MRCPACGKPFQLGDRKATTVTGRVVHEACEQGITAAAAGLISTPSAPVEGAITTKGWFERIRARRRAGRAERR